MAHIINFPAKVKNNILNNHNPEDIYISVYSSLKAEKRETIKASDKLFRLIIDIFGIDKSIQLLSQQKSHIYLYWFSISHNFQDGVLYEILETLQNQPIDKLKDFFHSVYALQVNKQNSLEVLSKVSLELKGEETLSNGLNIENNYLKFILNKCHFSKQDKINSIINACKIAEGNCIVKNGNLFINTQKDGNITEIANVGSGESRALGLYCDDVQYLNSYNFNIFTPDSLIEFSPVTHFDSGYKSYLRLNSNENITVVRKKIIFNSFFEKIHIINKNEEDITCYIDIQADIKDIFEVRSKIHTEEKITCNEIKDNNSISIECTYKSGRKYGLITNISSHNNIEKELKENTIKYKVIIPAQSDEIINIKISPVLNTKRLKTGLEKHDFTSYDEANAHIKNTQSNQLTQIKVKGSIDNLQKTVNRAISDIKTLTNFITIKDKTYSYIGAGLPRYSALFGRDSIITALEIMKFNPEIAKNTIELLALFQGQDFYEKHKEEIYDIENSKWAEPVKNASINGIKELYIQREEEKGKILHELRVGELAQKGIIPHSPYYGTVDATPLWIWLLCEYVNQTNDYEFFNQYSQQVTDALSWIEANTIDGFLRFTGNSSSKVKIKNQGWKDAGDSIRHLISYKGKLTNPQYPIALAEVQGYVYKAYLELSKIHENLGNQTQYNCLKAKATDLKMKFNDSYWCQDIEFYAMALDANNKEIKNITSNIGHCLTCGIIDANKTNIIEEKLMSEEMFSGWGIRTLANNHPAYDPISYHNGSVWTHDTAFCAMGMTISNKERILKALLESSNEFDNNRLPELFGGFDKTLGSSIINYPEACSPQAWSSGSILWLLSEYVKDKTNIPSYIEEFTIC